MPDKLLGLWSGGGVDADAGESQLEKVRRTGGAQLAEGQVVHTEVLAEYSSVNYVPVLPTVSTNILITELRRTGTGTVKLGPYREKHDLKGNYQWGGGGFQGNENHKKKKKKQKKKR